MSLRLSDAMRNKLLDGGASGGIKAGLNGGFLYIYSGSQPNSANTAASGTRLGKVTVNDDGSTGLGFDSAASGVLSKAAAQAWKFHGLANGIAGWYRLCESTDNPDTTDATKARIDGAIGTSGAELNLSNVSIVTNQVNTVDAFTITMPAA
jgi:hypothetical protein